MHISKKQIKRQDRSLVLKKIYVSPLKTYKRKNKEQKAKAIFANYQKRNCSNKNKSERETLWHCILAILPLCII